jgi:hypothetical protein
MRINDLMYWIRERHSIYLKKQAGKPKPWTKDKILQQYRFCCVYRELDKVTTWIRQNWRAPNEDHPDVWFAMAIARLINWPDTLAELKFPIPWKPMHFMKVLNNRRACGEKVYTGAYMIHADGEQGYSKPDYQALKVFNPMWKQRAEIRPRDGDTLASFYDRLSTCQDMGSFMAGQVIADAKFTGPLRWAQDWWTWAISGPGSRKGLNIVLGRDSKAKWKESEWKKEFDKLYPVVRAKVEKLEMPGISAQDCQNALCEFSKYWRVQHGGSPPRSRYPGLPESGKLF